MYLKVECYENGEIKTMTIKSFFTLMTGKISLSDFKKHEKKE